MRKRKNEGEGECMSRYVREIECVRAIERERWGMRERERGEERGGEREGEREREREGERGNE